MANKKSMQQLLSDFRNAKGRMEDLNNQMPRIMGVEAVKVVVENFALQGYDSGTGFHPWQKRADVTNYAYDYNRNPNAQNFRVSRSGKVIRGKKVFVTSTGKSSKAKNSYKGSTFQSSNPILEQTRTLKRSIRYFLRKNGVTIGVDPSLVVYAQKMNEGGKGKWGKKAATNTPARPFMPKPHEPPNKKILDRIKDKARWETEQRMRDFKQYQKKRR